MTDSDIDRMLAEDRRRRSLLVDDYSPVRGRSVEGRSLRRVAWEQEPVWLPDSMIADPAFARLTDEVSYARLRQDRKSVV